MGIKGLRLFTVVFILEWLRYDKTESNLVSNVTDFFVDHLKVDRLRDFWISKLLSNFLQYLNKLNFQKRLLTMPTRTSNVR